MRTLLLSLLLLVLPVSVVAADTGVRVAVSDPRDFGYFLGDVFRRDIKVTAPTGAKLNLASLPRPGPINYWLELRAVDIEEDAAAGAAVFRITLEYQAFYSALDPRRLTVPGFTLQISSESGTENAEIPQWSFVMSPVRELFPGKESEPTSVNMQPDMLAPLLKTGHERTVLLVSAGFVLLLFVLLARHFAWWPFHHRPGRPFTEAARFLKVNAAQLSGEGGYRAALLKLHRAFDTAAGRRLLPDDLDAFLQEHPQYAPFAPDIERLFASSRQAFFAGTNGEALAAMPLEQITELGSRLGAAERGAA